MEPKVTSIVFSPAGSTDKVAAAFCAAAGWRHVQKIDLIENPLEDEKSFDADEIVVIAMPVYFGRIPEIVLPTLAKLRGDKTPFIAIAVYGNRHYEDALHELCDGMTNNGFELRGAAAFIAKHSMYPEIAADRPDEKDREIMETFAKACVEHIAANTKPSDPIPGNKPYRPYATIPIVPTGSADCTRCGQCVRICPANAITSGAPRKTDKKRCIQCTACIHVCPVDARAFRGILYAIGRRKLRKQCASYRTPEFFA